jgi:hypothetical protein
LIVSCDGKGFSSFFIRNNKQFFHHSSNNGEGLNAEKLFDAEDFQLVGEKVEDVHLQPILLDQVWLLLSKTIN